MPDYDLDHSSERLSSSLDFQQSPSHIYEKFHKDTHDCCNQVKAAVPRCQASLALGTDLKAMKDTANLNQEPRTNADSIIFSSNQTCAI